MASEHSPDQSKRTFLASFAQLGSPAGLILATLMFKLVTSFDDAAFLDWAWRVPFLFSALLLAIGFIIRLSVKESPDFLDEQARREKAAKETKAAVETLPLKEVLKGAPGLLLLAIGANWSLGIAGFYFTNTFMLVYTTQYLHLQRGLVLNCLLVVSVMQFFITPLAALIASKIGNRRFLVLTSALSVLTPYAMFTLVDTGSLFNLTIGIGLAVLCLGAYYAVIAGYVSDCFPTRIRYTGISMAYQVSGAIFGGLTPMLGTILAEKFQGHWWPLALLFSAISLLSMLCVFKLAAQRRAA